MAEYINGKEMYAELVIYNTLYKKSLVDGHEKPQVSKKLAHSIIQIATRLTNSYNFVNYTYKDEMISDAILKCLDKVHRFDPTISEQSFAFFTQVAWNACVNRIKIEQKESSVKARLIREKMSSEFVSHGVDSDADDGGNSFVEFLKENDAFVDYIEIKKNKVVSTHPNMTHRNKTPYAKKHVEVVDDYYFDLSEFEGA